jgi:hypothetical protein
MIRIRFDGCDLSRPRGTPVNRVYPYDRGVARYDGIADWYDTDFLGDVHDPGHAGLRLEHFEELENRPYPFAIALRWRR